MTTHLYALLPDLHHAAALVIELPGEIALPQAEIAGEIDPMQIDRVQAALIPACGLPLNVLRCLAFADQKEEHRSEMLYLCETREEAFPADARTAALADLRPEALVPAALRDGLSAGLAEAKAQAEQGAAWQPPPLRAEWTLPGWYARVEAWIATQMACRGLTVEAIESLKSWSISVVLRVQTSARPVYFKASRDLPLFVNEGVVMAALARLFPGSVPAPLAVDSARGWMLLEDFGEPLGRRVPIEMQARMYQEMARIQIASSGQIDALLRAGCIDRRLPWLQARLDALLDDEISFSEVAPADRETLRRALPHLHALLAELEALPIPHALVHGDLHTGNVSLHDGNLLFFDWTDAAVTHPFFDIFDIFFEGDPAKREILEAAYRAPWEEIYPTGQVRRALDLARVLFGLYHAVSYQFLLNNIEEAERPVINSVNFFLRPVLQGLAAEGLATDF